MLVAMTYAGAVVAALLAWDVSRERPAHRTVAALLTFGVLADLVRRASRVFVLVPAYAALGGAPATGWPRIAMHVDEGLFIAYLAALAAVVAWIYIGRRPWAVAIGYVGAELVFVASYPELRAERISKAYLGFQLASLTVAVGSIIHWMMFRKSPPTVTHWIAGLMVAVEIANVAAGPWRLGIFSRWDLAQMGYCALYAVLILIQWRWSWAIRNSTPRS